VQILLVEARVKPEMRERFIEVITYDASHSEKDEPGCLRFDVLEDANDPNRFFFYEVYRDADAVAAHRQTPHFERFFSQLGDLLEGGLSRNVLSNVHPTDGAWR